MVYLVQQQESLEIPLVDMLSSIAPKDLGVWLATKIDFLKTGEAKQARKALFEIISQDPAADKDLKSVIQQLNY